MPVGDYPRLGSLGGVEPFRALLAGLHLEIPCDTVPETGHAAPLAQPLALFGKRTGNRICVQPMEGWDGTPDGRPTEHTVRRWRRFGRSGAKLVWGGEAIAVRHDGRANPNQLLLTRDTVADIARLREELVRAHAEAHGSTSDLVVGLQLTHSGRFARPDRHDRAEPVILYRHPLLDRRCGIASGHPVLTDGEVRRLVDDFVATARLAADAGFDFVDVKHCHGYLGHEFLSAFTREGAYGGSLANRTRFLREVTEGIRAEAPSLGIGVRLSAFDLVPFVPDPDQSAPGRPGPGIPESYCDALPYLYAFGAQHDQPVDIDLAEPLELFDLLRDLGITAVNVTAGSPCYNPHIQRPALYPPSDGYLPPEDPLVGVARQMVVTREIKRAHPDFTLVGTAYTYLQEYLPHVAQAAVREGWTDFVGLGRMMLAYPEMPADVLAGRSVQAKRVCRTLSDCTTAPRNGLLSGCYPMDEHYRRLPDMAKLTASKRRARATGTGEEP